MTREFIIFEEFESSWSKLGLTDDNLRKLQNFLLENPDFGDVIQGTGGVRKIRWTINGKGKSGGVRVIYLDIVVAEKILFLTAYPKNEKANLSKAERNELKQFVDLLKKLYK